MSDSQQQRKIAISRHKQRITSTMTIPLIALECIRILHESNCTKGKASSLYIEHKLTGMHCCQFNQTNICHTNNHIKLWGENQHCQQKTVIVPNILHTMDVNLCRNIHSLLYYYTVPTLETDKLLLSTGTYSVFLPMKQTITTTHWTCVN